MVTRKMKRTVLLERAFLVAALTWALLTIIRVTLGSVHARLPQWGAAREEKEGRRVRNVERLPVVFRDYMWVFIWNRLQFFKHQLWKCSGKVIKHTVSNEFPAGSINYKCYFLKEHAEFAAHLSELLSRDWQLPETEFSALLQGSSTCTGHNGKIKDVYAHVLCVQMFQKKKRSILKLNFFFENFGSMNPIFNWQLTGYCVWSFPPKRIEFFSNSYHSYPKMYPKIPANIFSQHQ